MITIVVTLSLFAQSALPADRFECVRQRIRSYVDEEKVPSIAIAVVDGGSIVWEDGFGWADREKQVAATAHTPYMLASTSKPITATAVLIACEKGILDLNAGANRYLGNAQFRSRLGVASNVTIRDILMHRGGLPAPGRLR